MDDRSSRHGTHPNTAYCWELAGATVGAAATGVHNTILLPSGLV